MKLPIRTLFGLTCLTILGCSSSSLPEDVAEKAQPAAEAAPELTQLPDQEDDTLTPATTGAPDETGTFWKSVTFNEKFNREDFLWPPDTRDDLWIWPVEDRPIHSDRRNGPRDIEFRLRWRLRKGKQLPDSKEKFVYMVGKERSWLGASFSLDPDSMEGIIHCSVFRQSFPRGDEVIVGICLENKHGWQNAISNFLVLSTGPPLVSKATVSPSADRGAALSPVSTTSPDLHTDPKDRSVARRTLGRNSGLLSPYDRMARFTEFLRKELSAAYPEKSVSVRFRFALEEELRRSLAGTAGKSDMAVEIAIDNTTEGGGTASPAPSVTAYYYLQFADDADWNTSQNRNLKRFDLLLSKDTLGKWMFVPNDGTGETREESVKRFIEIGGQKLVEFLSRSEEF